MRYIYQTAKVKSPFDCAKCINPEKRNCKNIKGLKESATDDYKPNFTQDIKEKKANKVFKLGDIRLYECPLTYITRETNLIIEQLFLIADSSVLLYPGTWLDQPNWFVEAFNIYKKERQRDVETK